MDRNRFALSHASTPVTGDLPQSERLIASRLKARHSLTKAIDHRTGPILLTGDYGVGKTRLRKSVEAESKPGRDWVNIDVAPGTTVADFYAGLNYALAGEMSAFDRSRLGEHLGLRRLDKSEWILAVDEAHNLSELVLEEIRLLSNRLGSVDGFAAILLVGHSTLVRRLTTRANQGLAERVAAHVHLTPLDADEVLELLKHQDASRDWPVDMVERIHILSEGRPGRIVRIVQMLPTSPAPTLTRAPFNPPQTVAPAAVLASDSEEDDYESDEPEFVARPDPLMGPSKPPIVVGDGLIEVGWEPEAEGDEMAEDTGHFGALADRHASDDPDELAEEGEERINDHYAALQAWQEWSANQGRPPETAQRRWTEPAEASAQSTPAGQPSPLENAPNLWVDEEHGFAPLSRLFGRKTQENEAE